MGKVAILCDTNCGIMKEEAEELGVHIQPMPFYINDELFYEGVNLTQKDFYERQTSGARITTSMPLVGDVMDKWDELLKDHDEVVYIPMSSGLSSSCETAAMLAEDYDGRVQVVDNHRISVTQKLSVYEAVSLANEGKSAKEIKDYLEAHRAESHIYIMVDTLEYLKKGGRLTPAVAALGTLFHIKPVLQIQGEKLDTFAKVRTLKQAKAVMLDKIAKDMDEDFRDKSGEGCIMSIAHTQNRAEAEIFREEALERFPGHDIIIDPLALSIACHIGPGSLAITTSKSFISKIRETNDPDAAK
ncbi:MAG: DegV family protein [Lachnospiraceae bacterium]|nr:DegV family protein [Lachnospiraceae bacterium]